MTLMPVKRRSKLSFSQINELPLQRVHRYGAVVRGQNAYVPPGARKSVPPQQLAATTSEAVKPDVPKVSVSGPDGQSVPTMSTPR